MDEMSQEQSDDDPTSESDDTSTHEGIATWVRADERRPYCARPFNQMAVLSDGSVVCACIDAEKTNPLGDFKTQTLDAIWNGPRYRALRRAIATNIDAVPICRGCPNRIAGPPPAMERGKELVATKPRALFLESYAGCNLECPGCNREGIEGSRTALSLDFETYRGIIDQLAPDLAYMEFHLGGENYMHKQASEMVRYCRDRNPRCVILSSTNGHFFHTDERANQALDSGIDCLIFSVDGATQESYARYRVNGRLDRVLDGMRRMARLRAARGATRPLLVWRYILFDWNDSRAEMDLARRLAQEIGIDHLCWHLNAVDGQQASKRYYVGSPHLAEIEHELWDTLPARPGVTLDVDFSSYQPVE
jgi:pyruvate-formate lyase-activating enzyme